MVAIRSEDKTKSGAGQSAGRTGREGHPRPRAGIFRPKTRSALCWRVCAARKASPSYAVARASLVADILSFLQHLPETSLPTLTVAAASVAFLIGMEVVEAPLPRSAGGDGRSHRGVVALRPRPAWRLYRGPHSSGSSVIVLPDIAQVQALLPGALGIALMSFTETIAAGRAFVAPQDPPIAPNRELVATGAANIARRTARRDAGRWRHVADEVVRSVGGRSQTASLVTAGSALATMLLLSPVLGLLPNAALAAVVIVYSVPLIQPAEFRAIRKVRRMEFRWALAARRRAALRHAEGHRRRDHPVHDRTRQPNCSSTHLRDRA